MLHHKPRIEDRTTAIIGARMRDPMGEREVCVVDVSTRGLLLSADEPPPRGEFVDLNIGGHNIVGQVAWSGPRRFGVRLRERISVIGLISGDTGKIALKARDVQARQKARTAKGTVQLGRAIQLAGMLGALACGAWLLAGYVGEGLDSVKQAKAAMARAG